MRGWLIAVFLASRLFAYGQPDEDRVPVYDFGLTKPQLDKCCLVLTEEGVPFWDKPELQVRAGDRGHALVALGKRKCAGTFQGAGGIRTRGTARILEAMFAYLVPQCNPRAKVTIRANGCVMVVGAMVTVNGAKWGPICQEDQDAIAFQVLSEVPVNGVTIFVVDEVGQQRFVIWPGGFIQYPGDFQNPDVP